MKKTHILFSLLLLATLAGFQSIFAADLPLVSSDGFGLPFSNATTNEDTANGVAKIIKEAILFTGVFAIMALTYGGILMMISYGDDGKVKSAKGIITYALVGVVLAGAAYAIIEAVYNFSL